MAHEEPWSAAAEHLFVSGHFIYKKLTCRPAYRRASLPLIKPCTSSGLEENKFRLLLRRDALYWSKDIYNVTNYLYFQMFFELHIIGQCWKNSYYYFT